MPSCLTPDERNALIEQYGGRCAYCGDRVYRRMCMEHVAPMSRGGADEPWNLLPSCLNCNSSKGDLHPLEWVFMVHGLLVNARKGKRIGLYVPGSPRLGQPTRHWMTAPTRRVTRVRGRGRWRKYEVLDCGHYSAGGYMPAYKRPDDDPWGAYRDMKVGAVRRCEQCIPPRTMRQDDAA